MRCMQTSGCLSYSAAVPRRPIQIVPHIIRRVFGKGALADQDQNPAAFVIKAGNSFFLRFVIALALVTFFILPRLPEAQRKVNNNIGEGERLIDSQRIEMNKMLRQNKGKLKSLNSESLDSNVFSTFGAERRSAQPTPQGRNHLQNQPKDFEHRRGELEKTRLELNEKLIKLNQDFVTLEKARIIRQFALPGTSFSLIETDVRMLFSGALGAAMLMLFNYRARLLKSLGSEPPIMLPLWAAPVPLNGFGRSFRSNLFLNIAGLTFIALLLSLYRDFTVRDEFYPDVWIAALQLLLGGTVTCLYGFESIRAIGKSFSKANERMK
jgi:hypothetical protein